MKKRFSAALKSRIAGAAALTHLANKLVVAGPEHHPARTLLRAMPGDGEVSQMVLPGIRHEQMERVPDPGSAQLIPSVKFTAILVLVLDVHRLAILGSRRHGPEGSDAGDSRIPRDQIGRFAGAYWKHQF